MGGRELYSTAGERLPPSFEPLQTNSSASGCTGWEPNAARYAVATSIFGPWLERDNPCVGPDYHLTFGGQGTYALPVEGKPDAFIFMADQWCPANAIDGRYAWLPIEFDLHADGCETVKVVCHDEWDPDIFRKTHLRKNAQRIQRLEVIWMQSSKKPMHRAFQARRRSCRRTRP